MKPNEKEELLKTLESVANFLRGGAMFDHRIPSDVKSAMMEKVTQIDAVVEKYLD